MKKALALFIFGFLFVLSWKLTYTISPTSKILGSQKEDSVRVAKVIDGDTIQAELGSKIETIRLIGIDAPERADSRKTVECFGIEASNKAKEILTGQTIELQSDETQGDRDRYGRLLRYVFLSDGNNFDKLMISEGYAYEYTYKGNPYKYQDEFKKAEQEARSGKKGLWGVCGQKN